MIRGHSKGSNTSGWASKRDASSVVPDLGRPRIKKRGNLLILFTSISIILSELSFTQKGWEPGVKKPVGIKNTLIPDSRQHPEFQSPGGLWEEPVISLQFSRLPDNIISNPQGLFVHFLSPCIRPAGIDGLKYFSVMRFDFPFHIGIK
jgi:hypothetical protein